MYQLQVRVVSGNNLPVGDLNGFSDPYIKLFWGGQVIKSSIKKKTLSPYWNETFMLSSSNPKEPLKVSCYDWDRFTKDDVLGTGEVPLDDLVNKTEKSITVHLSPRGEIHMRLTAQNFPEPSYTVPVTTYTTTSYVPLGAGAGAGGGGTVEDMIKQRYSMGPYASGGAPYVSAGAPYGMQPPAPYGTVGMAPPQQYPPQPASQYPPPPGSQYQAPPASYYPPPQQQYPPPPASQYPPPASQYPPPPGSQYPPPQQQQQYQSQYPQQQPPQQQQAPYGSYLPAGGAPSAFIPGYAGGPQAQPTGAGGYGGYPPQAYPSQQYPPSGY